MRLWRHLQHWLSGQGPRLHVADCVPEPPPIRPWAATFPWAALITAIEQNFAQRVPTPSKRGRRPVAVRVLLALELLKHELGASDEQMCHRLRTDLAVMDACGITEVQVDRSQAHAVRLALRGRRRARRARRSSVCVSGSRRGAGCTASAKWATARASRVSVLAHGPGACAQSRTWRGWTTTRGQAAAASAATTAQW